MMCKNGLTLAKQTGKSLSLLIHIQVKSVCLAAMPIQFPLDLNVSSLYCFKLVSILCSLYEGHLSSIIRPPPCAQYSGVATIPVFVSLG